MNARALGRAARTVVAGYLQHRNKQSAITERLRELRTKHAWRGAKPLQPEHNVLATLLVAIDLHVARTAKPTELRCHPAAKRFPGAVAPKAKRVRAHVSVDVAVPRWHSTGLYAAPGEPVEVAVPELPAGVQLEIRVGCHTDSVLRRPRWKRYPSISRRFAIAPGATEFVGNAFGGLIYVVVRHPSDEHAIRSVTIRGAVRAPHFVLGKTSLADWRKKIRHAPAPFGELECDAIVLSLPSQTLGKLDDPASVLRYWTKVVRVQDDLACFERRSPERFVFDVQISNGYMHSGYPLMGPVSAAPHSTDLATLREKGNWGMFHEIGHNHQTAHYGRYANPWTFDGTIEVTVNIFASYTYVAALHRAANMGHQHWRHDELAKNLTKAWTSQPFAKRSDLEKCLFWVQLASELGWPGMRKLFSMYAKLPPEKRPRDNLAKRSLLLQMLAKHTHKNFAAFFAAWGLEVTDAARANVAKLATFQPSIPLPPH